MIVLVIAYFAIITVNQSSTQDSYGVTVLTPSAPYENFKPFRSKSSNKNSVYPQTRNNIQPSLSQGSMLSSTTGTYKTDNRTNTEGNRYTYGQSYYNQHSTPTATATTGRSSTSGTLSTGTTVNAPVKSMAKGTSMTRMSSGNTRPFGAPSDDPFSDNISPGLPDPGGNSDDSCEDDIVFLPVPDGLWYMIFLSIIYALFKLLGERSKRKSIFKQITSI